MMKKNEFRMHFIGRKRKHQQESYTKPLLYKIEQNLYADTIDEAREKLEEKYIIQEIL